VIESLLLENGFQAVVLYRMAYVFKKKRIPLMGPLLCRLSIWLTGVEIAPEAEIGPGLIISHGQGIVVGGRVKMGSQCVLLHQVTLGSKGVLGSDGRRELEDMPRLGDGVLVGAGAKLIGDITVGDGATIGPNAVVTRDVPAGGLALAPFAEIKSPNV
jgi:serine O-acetyltransferase